MGKKFICPQPGKWHEIFKSLESARKERNDRMIGKAPVPLILEEWAHSPRWEKELRWHEYLEWAREHGFIHLIPQLAEEDSYFGEEG